MDFKLGECAKTENEYMKNRLLVISSFIVLFISGAAMAQDTPYNVQDLVGTRASSGDSQLRSRGYLYIKTTTGGDVKWANWWNNGSRTCITVATLNGVYDSIVSGPAQDCNRSTSSGNNDGWNNGGWNNNNNNGNWGWGGGNPNNVPGLGKPGVTVYDDRNYRGTSQSFGVGRYLNNARQLGALRNDEASSVVVLNGYKVRFCEGEGSGNGSGRCEELGAGNYNLRLNDEASYIEVTRVYGGGNWGNNNNGNWGNGNNGNWGGSPAEINDLTGVGTFSGNARLLSRGFRLVDTMRQGSTSYTIWWRSNSRQCVQVTVAGGRYESVNDIGSHPRCR